MKEKITKLIYPLLALTVGLLFIILLKLPYISGLDGYNLLAIYTTGFLGFVIMVFQFLQIVALLLLLNLGILGLLEKKGVVEFKKQIWGCSYNSFVKILISVVAGLSLLSLIFLIIFCAVNSVTIGFGSIFNSVLQILCAVLVWLLASRGILDGTYVVAEKKPRKTKSKKADVETPEETLEEETSVEVEPESVKIEE